MPLYRLKTPPRSSFAEREAATEKLDVNYIWAYVYITKSPAGHVRKVWYDNIVAAKKYIGPISR